MPLTVSFPNLGSYGGELARFPFNFRTDRA